MHYLKMKSVLLCLAAVLALAACGESSSPSTPAATPTQARSDDPRYLNPLLNFPPPQFNEVLADCGKLLFGEHEPPKEIIASCRAGIKERAAKQGQTVTDANLDEPLVKQRYQFMQKQAASAAQQTK